MARKAKTETVFYHGLFAKPVELQVINRNDDGTVDIGSDADTIAVRRCRIVDSPEAGACTLSVPAEAAAPDEPAAAETTEKPE